MKTLQTASIGTITLTFSLLILFFFLKIQIGWQGYLSIVILSFTTLWVILEYAVYKPLKKLHQKLLLIRRRKLHQPVIHENKDVIEGIEESFRALTGTVTIDMKHLQQVEGFMKDYVGEVSHELKTPIFSIQAFLETLLDGAIDDKNVNRKFLKQALKNVNRLNNLVQDLLIISQIESGQLKMEQEEFKIKDLINDVLESLQTKFTDKGRNIKSILQLDVNESVEVFADRERIHQVLENLIDNAIKYGNQQGAITIQLIEKENKIWISIIDEGEGIEPQYLSHIFERFYRVEKSRSRQMGGTGLGLSIVKYLIEAHNETVEVESVLNKGTTFRFSLQKV